MHAARVVEGIWDGEGAAWRLLRAALAPAAFLYGGGARARRAAYRTGVFRGVAGPARVVSIGNLRVGGTGKTPLTRWLAAELAAHGRTVAIASRGYGGSATAPHVVGDGTTLESDVATSGDEAVMLARTSGVPVVAGRERAQAVTLAVTRFGADLVLCDDAFQHLALRRDIDLVLIDAAERGGVTRLLPAGPLREPLAALGDADVVLVRERGLDDRTPWAATRPGQLVVHVQFAPTALVTTTSTGWRERPLAGLAGRRVLAVSGVARPAPLYGTIADWEAELVRVLEYPDHYAYDTAAWQEIAQAARDVDLVVTTEKDLVKLERFPFARDKLVAVRLGVAVDEPEALLARVAGDPAEAA